MAADKNAGFPTPPRNAAAPADPDSAAPVTGARFALVFATLLVARLGCSISANIISTALPTIEGELGGVELMQWITTAYIMATTVMMPVYGRLGDVVGRKYLILAALGLYTLGNLVCMCAPSMAWLIAGRAISGLGGGGTVILAQSIVGGLCPRESRSTYLAILGTTFTAGAFLGPLAGGWIIEVANWRAIFAATLPFGLLGIAGCAAFLPRPHGAPDPDYDLPGTLLLACGVVALTLFSSAASSRTASSALPAAALFCAVAVFCAAFVRRDLRARQPIMPAFLFRNRNFVIATVSSMICWLTFMGLTYYFPTWLQIAKGMSPALAGLSMAAALGGNMVSSTATGFIASRTGRCKWMCVGMFPLAAAGYYLLSTVGVETPVATILCYLFVAGFGLGLGSSILLLVVQNEFPVELVGTATGTHNFFKQIGKTLGSAVVGTVFSTGLATHLSGALPASVHLTFRSITPALVDKLPDALRATVQAGYTQALMPVYFWYVPLLAAGCILCCFLKESSKPRA